MTSFKVISDYQIMHNYELVLVGLAVLFISVLL